MGNIIKREKGKYESYYNYNSRNVHTYVAVIDVTGQSSLFYSVTLYSISMVLDGLRLSL